MKISCPQNILGLEASIRSLFVRSNSTHINKIPYLQNILKNKSLCSYAVITLVQNRTSAEDCEKQNGWKSAVTACS